MTNKIYKFDSGLTVLYCKNTLNNATNLNIEFDCGARCDEELAGLSHFCEHMFFTGTDKLSKQDMSKKYFDFIRSNAYTSGETIVFTGEIFTHKLSEYLNTVTDMILNSTFNKNALEEEKKVVIQEIVQASSKSERRAYDLFKYEIFNNEYCKFSILGSESNINKITRSHVKNYVKKYFVNNNCHIYICSPLSFGRVKNIIAKHFESKLPTNNIKPLSYNEDDYRCDDKLAIYHNSSIEKSFLKFAFKIERDIKDIRIGNIYQVISNIIGDLGDGLFKRIRLDNALTYSLECDWFSTKDTFTLTIETVTSKENIKPCIDIITEYISNLSKDGFTREELDKAKMHEGYYWQTRLYTPNSYVNKLKKYRTYNKFVYDNELHKDIELITLDELNKQTKKLFSECSLIVFVYGNATKKDVYTLKQIQKKLM